MNQVRSIMPLRNMVKGKASTSTVDREVTVGIGVDKDRGKTNMTDHSLRIVVALNHPIGMQTLGVAAIVERNHMTIQGAQLEKLLVEGARRSDTLLQCAKHQDQFSSLNKGSLLLR